VIKRLFSKIFFLVFVLATLPGLRVDAQIQTDTLMEKAEELARQFFIAIMIRPTSEVTPMN